jgi:hypothetical protein
MENLSEVLNERGYDSFNIVRPNHVQAFTLLPGLRQSQVLTI